MRSDFMKRKREWIAVWERNELLTYLAKWNWNVSHAAKDLEIDRANLCRRMRNLGIKRPERTE
jgi:transcriptional regulator of acetoin/glycerol metabolism